MSDRVLLAAFHHRRIMRLGTCLLLAVMSGALGLTLRLAMPVTPVDASFRDVMRLYPSQAAPTGSNTRETSLP